MKKSQLVFAILFMFSIKATAQEKWVSKKLDEKLSVRFPSEPEKITKNGNESFITKEKDSVTYGAGLIDMNVIAKMDSATLAPMKENPIFAEKLVAGIALQKPNYKFGAVKIGSWNSLTTYNVSGFEETTKNTIYLQIIFIESKLYTLACRIPANLTTKKKELFFNSATLLK